jgi:threonyl-tRNA synthetase
VTARGGVVAGAAGGGLKAFVAGKNPVWGAVRGAIGGLSRVRAMQLNDAHIFCRLEQVAEEAANALGLINQAYQDMGISASRYVLALPSEDASFGDPSSKYVGDAASWAHAAGLLREVLDNAGMEYQESPGDAAFYGPKDRKSTRLNSSHK